MYYVLCDKKYQIRAVLLPALLAARRAKFAPDPVLAIACGHIGMGNSWGHARYLHEVTLHYRLSQNRYERLEDNMGPASSSSLSGAETEPYFPDVHTHIEFKIQRERAWLQLGSQERQVGRVSDLSVRDIAILPGTAESLREVDKKLYRKWTEFVFDERIQFYGPFSCLYNFIQTLPGSPAARIAADKLVPLYVGKIMSQGSLSKHDFGEEDIVYSGYGEYEGETTGSIDPWEASFPSTAEIAYKIRDKLYRSFKVGLLDERFFLPLLVGPLKPEGDYVRFQNFADPEKYPPEKKVDLKITSGGVVPRCLVDGEVLLPDAVSEDDITLVDHTGACLELTERGRICGKDYVMEVLDKGEIYVEMVRKKYARNVAKAIKQFKSVQGFFERAAALGVSTKLALVEAKQSGVDLREFSNLCALGHNQHVNTILRMPTLLELAATVFPVRWGTYEANLTGFTMSEVTSSLYHANPDPQSNLN